MYYEGSFEEANKEREVKHFRTRLPSKVQIPKPNTCKEKRTHEGYTDHLTCAVVFRC